MRFCLPAVLGDRTGQLQGNSKRPVIKTEVTAMIARTLAATGTLFLSLCLLASRALAQNPVPFIDSLSPTATEPGTGQDLQLTIRGAGFSPTAKVNFNGATLTPNAVMA